MTLSKRDKQIVWHPFTQEKLAQDVISVDHAKGSYIYDENGKSYLDLISSWWVNLHGHAHPKIAQSIYTQALKLEHVIFAGFTHKPAVDLCESLQEILPKELKKFFFSDNGSTTVEVAIKMAYQYWYNQKFKERNIFLSFDGGYHGDTFGAMSVGHRSGFHDIFSEFFFKVLAIPYPATWDQDQDISRKEYQSLLVLDEYLNQHGSEIAAIILEPLIQGASGMRTCRPQFLTEVIYRVRKYDILVIFDEVMTGFGRTGEHFALSTLGITPDFLCISKGITGGFLPLGLTITTEHIYNQFLSNEWQHAFAHGHSYTANPISCAAAIASLELLKSIECQNAIKSINEAHIQSISVLKSASDKVIRPRIIGTISAFDIKEEFSLNTHIKSEFLKEGLLLRPLGQTIYLLPPYSTSFDEINYAYEKIAQILNRL